MYNYHFTPYALTKGTHETPMEFLGSHIDIMQSAAGPFLCFMLTVLFLISQIQI